ncbi:leucine--tRNA ligase [Nocardia neocaledoniensis NBRC 108232]|uniref:Leucine--tRNA ligase n=1 Tax=Nocardia neocaledoniensis TaxID=236511 RepID=A0A317NMS9_9NOCA|nr:leucine--tRNA ligase [Nocardia neocaledoniensis]PWV76113.1 leucyl-tRNA synthetase [Nocardia neocaledoniensis]GEM34193.1 leucine--tRNA ligase [Nocardia neocaledoniensis NBRC 108232]
MQDTRATESDVPQHRYNAELAGRIERRWQQNWAERGTFHAPNPVGPLAGDTPADKLFIQDMFPFPSGAGLHVGHPLGYIATDVFGRYHRMRGRNVLHALGYDAFGLPAEQYAVATGAHPRVTTESNIATMQRQLDRLGLGHDSRRSFATTDPEYYRWTQWIFLRIYNAWYDQEAGRARPIAELEEQFATGARAVPEGDWNSMSGAERGALLDSYRLVYQSDSIVNWCPGLGTVLSNEEVTADGRSERGNFPVFRKRMWQWMMRITAYADRLVDDLDELDWPDNVKSMQRNWIGRSRGAQVRFEADGETLEVFTTRPDTLFGATYVVLAPEHELVDKLTATVWPDGTEPGWTNGGAATPAQAVAAYRESIAAKSDLERQENKEKTGVFLGSYATNPANGKQVPIFIADYVLSGYGTGAIMAVPGHDGRDWDFATALGLPIVEVISGGDITEGAWSGDGELVNSDFLNGLSVDEAKAVMIGHLEADGHGTGKVQYKLRDWLFARQRYWGEPFPIVYDEQGVAHALPESMLPVELPEMEDFAPVTFDPDDANSEPSPPLAKATDWVTVELDLGDGPKKYRRDTNVMPNWAGSSWYQLRYADPTNTEAFCAPENEQYWLGPRTAEHGPNDPGGVDLYVGGVEHAVLHLLYARFWQKVLFDLGDVTGSEPYRRLFNQGYVQGYAYTDARGAYVPAAEVVERDDKFFWTGADGVEIEVNQEYGKIGKSLKNAISPDEMCDLYGADTFRFYEMSMGPLDTSRPWATKDVVGAHRFLQRVWRLAIDEETGAVKATDAAPSDETLRLVHRTIAGVDEDLAALRDNTAGAKLIELTNHLTKNYPDGAPRAAVEPLVLMLAPLAPHIAEELWERLGHTTSLAHGPFPTADPALLVADSVEYPIQVKGKVRSRIQVPADADPATIEAAALADEKIVALLEGAAPRKVIVVPGKMVNIVP